MSAERKPTAVYLEHLAKVLRARQQHRNVAHTHHVLGFPKLWPLRRRSWIIILVRERKDTDGDGA